MLPWKLFMLENVDIEFTKEINNDNRERERERENKEDKKVY